MKKEKCSQFLDELARKFGFLSVVTSDGRHEIINPRYIQGISLQKDGDCFIFATHETIQIRKKAEKND